LPNAWVCRNKFEWTENTFSGKAGQEFIFIGLHANVAAIKSLHGIDYCWIEEAETVSEESWRVLLPTLRKNSTELYVSFNPRDEEDATSVRWIKNPPPGAVVVKVTHEDNPFLPEIMKMQIRHDVAKDPEMAAHVCLANTARTAKRKSSKDVINSRSSSRKNRGLVHYYGLDFGFAKDPLSSHEYWMTATLCMCTKNRGAGGVELNDIPKNSGTIFRILERK